MRARVDTTGWDKAVRKLAKVGKDKLSKLMEQSAKLIVGDVVRYTPPMGSSPSTESFNTKRAIGMGAVAKQITTIYGDLMELGVVKENGKLGKSIKKLAKSNPSACADLLNKIGYPTYRVIVDFDDSFHRKARDNRGRVRWSSSKGQVYVLKKNAIKKYIKKEQAKVGQGMSGWAKAVKAVKTGKIPAWAKKRHDKTRGRAAVRKGKGFDWAFMAVNSVPYIGKTTQGINTVGRAIRNQERNLTKRIEQAIKHSGKQAGFK